MPKSVTTSAFGKGPGRSGAGSVKLSAQPVRKDGPAVTRSFNTSSLGNPFTGRKARASGGDTK